MARPSEIIVGLIKRGRRVPDSDFQLNPPTVQVPVTALRLAVRTIEYGLKWRPRHPQGSNARQVADAIEVDERATLALLKALLPPESECGHRQSAPTDEEIASCPEVITRVCACGTPLWWNVDTWRKL